MGQAKPRATVVARFEGGDEELRIPMAVGCLLASKQKAGEIHVDTREELSYLIDSLANACANARIERLVNRRDYARQELIEKLELDGYRRQTIAQCIDRACTIGLVSDRRYADVYIRSKLAGGWGIGRVERELARKGIDVDELPGWPYEYVDPEDELTRAIDIAGSRRMTGERAYQKLVRFLCSRGFSLSVATKAASQVAGR